MKKRMVSLLLTVALLLSLFPSFAVHSEAAATSDTIFAVENAWAAAGTTVQVNMDTAITGIVPTVLADTVTLCVNLGFEYIEVDTQPL